MQIPFRLLLLLLIIPYCAWVDTIWQDAEMIPNLWCTLLQTWFDQTSGVAYNFYQPEMGRDIDYKPQYSQIELSLNTKSPVNLKMHNLDQFFLGSEE